MTSQPGAAPRAAAHRRLAVVVDLEEQEGGARRYQHREEAGLVQPWHPGSPGAAVLPLPLPDAVTVATPQDAVWRLRLLVCL